MAQRPVWTKEKIREGFERFKTKHDRLPNATEIDQIPYLPSSRWIQLKYGGLEKLRTQFGYKDSHFGKGRFRSRIARRSNKRGRDAEIELEMWLREKFGEVFVHTERMFDASKRRVDFYVYSPEGNFGIDIFYPDTLRTLQSNLNIKQKKYEHFVEPLYMAVANDSLTQDELNSFVNSKRNSLPKNVSVLTLGNLLPQLKKIKSYPNPLT